MIRLEICFLLPSLLYKDKTFYKLFTNFLRFEDEWWHWLVVAAVVGEEHVPCAQSGLERFEDDGSFGRWTGHDDYEVELLAQCTDLYTAAPLAGPSHFGDVIGGDDL